jgi:hypothetical protein
MGRHRHQISPKVRKVQCDAANCLSSVNMKEQVKVTATFGHLADWLQRSHLVVSPLQMHQGGFRCDRPEQFCWVDTAEWVNPNFCVLVSLRPFPNGRMFYSRVHNMGLVRTFAGH